MISPVSNTDISQWQDDGVIMTNFPGSDFPSFGWTSLYWYDETAVTTSITDGWITPDSTDLESDIDRGIRAYMGINTFDLSVSGEPRTGNQSITLTNGDEYVQVSGVVRPDDIQPDNTILSKRIANARITYSGDGQMNDAMKMPVLNALFMKFWPF